jgi:hypothetical protein
MDDAEVEEPFEGQYRHRTRENGIEAPMGFITPKGGIDPGVVNFRFPLYVLFDGQFFPLTAKVQEFQNVVEWRSVDWMNNSIGNQDKFPPDC